MGILSAEIFVKRKLECNNSCDDDKILEPKSSDSYGGITFFEDSLKNIEPFFANERSSQLKIYSDFNFSTATLYFCILNDTILKLKVILFYKLQTFERNRNFIGTRKLLGNVQVLTTKQQFASSTEAVSLLSSYLR